MAYITRLLERLNLAIHIKLWTKCLPSMQLSVDGYSYEFLILEFLIPSYSLYFYSQWAPINQPVLFTPWVWGQWHWPSLGFHNKGFLKSFCTLIVFWTLKQMRFLKLKKRWNFKVRLLQGKKIARFTFHISCLLNRLVFLRQGLMYCKLVKNLRAKNVLELLIILHTPIEC